MSALPANLPYRIQKIVIAVACGVLASCGSGTGISSIKSINPVNWITPYKVDVVQGNFVSREQVEQLQAGMTREQVKSVLGTPLITSLFHADRWDYVFTLKRQGVDPQSFKYAVFFKGDLLERFSGDAMPSEAEFISTLTNKRALGNVPVLEASEEQLKAAEKPSASKAAAERPAASSGAPAGSSAVVYPPLESPRR
ncbi:MAG: SmpA/OmlA domain protein [Polaromonas sp.]|jgi:outer membrane protein assembly factor BamE|nr:SmpA/OmlA domain protein [Polaromonas sp.]